MPDLLEQALMHRFIYLPRGTEKDTLGTGKQLGLALAHRRGVPLTVLSVQKDGATHHPELAKQTIVTERSGRVVDGGVVLVWCPRHKSMEKLHHLEDSDVVLVEWVPGEMEPWARINGALNVATCEVMELGLSEGAVEILDGIVYEGYKGWIDGISARMVRSSLDDLVALDEYNRDLVLAYARQTKSESSVERLAKIVDKFEASRGIPHSGPRRRAP